MINYWSSIKLASDISGPSIRTSLRYCLSVRPPIIVCPSVRPLLSVRPSAHYCLSVRPPVIVLYITTIK